MGVNEYSYYAEDVNGEHGEEEQEWGWTLSQEGVSAYFVAFLSLFAVTLTLSKYLHQYPDVGKILPEAGLTILIGMFAGYFIDLRYSIQEDDLAKNYEDDEVEDSAITHLLGFSPTVFFIALLPPIVFNSGYHLKRSLFFRHLTAIALYAVVGTTIATIVTGCSLYAVVSLGWGGGFEPSFTELLTFGALISATDPVSTLSVFQQRRVDPQLFYLVFGESTMSDAVCLLLFNALSKFVGAHDTYSQFFARLSLIVVDFCYLFLGSMALGVVCGLLLSLFFKVFDMRRTRLLELSLYVLNAYFPFFIAEMLELSGVVTILFTAIIAQRYAVYNISNETARNADVIFRLISHMAETAIFLNLGLSVFEVHSSGKNIYIFVIWAFIAILIARAANVYPISFFYNRAVIKSGEEDLLKIEQHNSKDFSKDFVAVRPVLKAGAKSGNEVLNPYNTDIYVIKAKTSHMLWHAGLRGAVCYACVETFPNANGNREAFVSITMGIVLMSVFLMGSTTNAGLNFFNIDCEIDEEKYMEEKKAIGFSRFQVFENQHILPFLLRDLNSDACKSEKEELLSQFFSDIDLTQEIPNRHQPDVEKDDKVAHEYKLEVDPAYVMRENSCQLNEIKPDRKHSYNIDKEVDQNTGYPQKRVTSPKYGQNDKSFESVKDNVADLPSFSRRKNRRQRQREHDREKRNGKRLSHMQSSMYDFGAKTLYSF